MGFAYEQSVGRVVIAYVIFGYTVAVQVISEVNHIAAVEYAHKPAAVIPRHRFAHIIYGIADVVVGYSLAVVGNQLILPIA